MDVVYPYKNESHWAENELRYSLRSLKLFSDAGQIYIIGDKPSWVKNIIHIPCGDYYKQNKGANIINKLILTASISKLSEHFLYMTDDKLFLKKMTEKDIKTYYNYDLSDFKFRGTNKMWTNCLKNAKDTLSKEGMPTYNYEPHTPVVLSKSIYATIMSRYDFRNIQYPTLSLYLNNRMEHEKIPDNYRCFFNYEKADLRDIRGKSFMCYSDIGLSSALQKWIMKRFPKKSKYER